MSSLINTLESAFSSLGLTSPTSRFLFMAGIGGIGEYFWRPSFSYDVDGMARPFVVLNPGDPSSTILPMGTTAIATGLAFALFV